MPTGGKADCQIDHKHASRGNGISAVGYAAYIGGEKMRDEETGRIYNYRRKTEVAFKKLFLPECAKGKFQTEEELWNSAQKQEKAKDARLALSLILPIPNELPLEDVKKIIDQFGTYLMEKSGGAVKVALHWKDGNHHIHVVMTERAFKETGDWDLKERKVYAMRPKMENGKYVYDENGDLITERVPMLEPDPERPGEMRQVVNKKDRNRKMWKRVTIKSNPLNDPMLFPEMRETWAKINNSFLSPERQMDPRSYRDQGIEKKPGKHLGPSAAALERRGIGTYRGDYNRAIKQENEELEKIQEIEKKKLELQDSISQTDAEMLRVAQRALEEIDERRETARRRATAIKNNRTGRETVGSGRTIGGSGEGLLTVAIRKLKSAVAGVRSHVLGVGRGEDSRATEVGLLTTAIKKLRSAVADVRSYVLGAGRGEDNRAAEEENIKAAISDTERSDAAVRAQLDERATMGRSGREKQRDRRGAR